MLKKILYILIFVAIFALVFAVLAVLRVGAWDDNECGWECYQPSPSATVDPTDSPEPTATPEETATPSATPVQRVSEETRSTGGDGNTPPAPLVDYNLCIYHQCDVVVPLAAPATGRAEY